MGDRITPTPDMSDERLAELIRWTGQSGMPDVHALLLDLRRHRAEEGAARVNLAAVGVTEDGPIDQLVCTLAGLYLELQQKTGAARTASAERVRAVVQQAIVAGMSNGGLGGFVLPSESAAIADRVATQLTAPPPGHVRPVPYGLGPDDLDILEDLADMVTRDDLATETAGSTRTRAVLDRILAMHRAPGVTS